jgi:hypothetical protein
MRRLAAFFALAICAALPGRADEATRDRVSCYFTGWYSVCPGTKVAVTDASEVRIPGYEAYRTERSCSLKNRDESGVTLVSRDGKQIFVGAVLHDDSRHDRPFSPQSDLPGVRDTLQGMFGLPVALSVGAGVSGALIPIDIRIQQVPGSDSSYRSTWSRPCRARERVLNAINTALTLGLNGTPVFFYRGAWLTSEPGLAENFILGKRGDAAAPADLPSSR